MKYLGGKSRTANQIAAYLNTIRQPGQPYWEPFVGAGWVLERINGQPIYASDANPALIEMWRALQNGWTPPEKVTRSEYKLAANGETTLHEAAFIGFGCSFGGKWFGGFAMDYNKDTHYRDYVRAARESVIKKAHSFSDVHFFTSDFMFGFSPAYGCLIYCDPPYQGVSGYDAVGAFDFEAFWVRVRSLEAHGHTVVVSEYAAPDDFSCVLEMPTKTNMNTRNGKDTRIEKLFRLGGHPKLQLTLFEVDDERDHNYAPEYA
jgi:DNA adenine methylase